MTDLKKSLKKTKSFLHVSVPSVLLQSCCNVPVILVALTLLKARAVQDSWKPLLPFIGIFHLSISLCSNTLQCKWRYQSLSQTVSKGICSFLLFQEAHKRSWQMTGVVRSKGQNLGLWKVCVLFSKTEPQLLCLYHPSATVLSVLRICYCINQSWIYELTVLRFILI